MTLRFPPSAPRLIIGAVYKKLGEKMELLWTDKLRLNTVHVSDVVAALMHLAEKGEQGEIYNLADSGDSSKSNNVQGSAAVKCSLF